MLTFEHVWPFVLLALVPLVWRVPRWTLTNFGARQRRLQAVVRSAIVALLALALAEPAIRRETDALSIVFAVDVSASIAPAAITDAGRWVADRMRRAEPGSAHALVFAGTARPLDDPTRLSNLGEADADADREATNLEEALTGALGRFVPGRVPRLVLLTDGRSTSGSLGAGLARLQQAGVRVYTVPLAERQVGDAWINDVVVPPAATADEPVPVEVEVFSQVARDARVAVRHGNEVLDRQEVHLAPGTTVVLLVARVAALGARQLDVVLEAGDDPFTGNNTAPAPVEVRPRPRLLYVEGRAASAGYLTAALRAGGFDVDQVPPAGLPGTPSELDRYEAVILSDVPRRELNDAQLAATERYVADLGGGLVMAGGEAMFGVDGYAETPIERAVPVTFTMRDRPDEFAMVIILDRSWSMVGDKIELAKEAARAALDVLPDRHRLGVLTFNDSTQWAVPLQPAGARAEIDRAIRAIVPSGHTNLFPAVEEAFKVLADATAGLKHVFVLSDGRTYPDAYEELVRKMVDARITVSSVAVGQEADRELLANLATWGRGRAYYVDNAAEVPQIFVKETQRATRSTFVEAPFRPDVEKPVELLRGLDLASAPPLAGYARTQLKETAELVLAAGDEDDPVLARWQYGLGRAVVFTSDVKDRWARDWLAWRGYGKFWTQLLRETIRRDPAGLRPTATLRLIEEPGATTLAIGLVGPRGEPVNGAPPVVEIGTGDVPTRVGSRQTGPGTYSAALPAQSGDAVLRVVDDAGDVLAEQRLVAGPDLEHLPRPPDLATLEAISRDTGGVFSPTPEQVTAPGPERAVRATPVWPWLAALAALLWMGDLLLRRVRVFEASIEP